MARKKNQDTDDLADIKIDFGDIAIPEVNLAALGFDTDEAGDPTPAMETRYIAPKPPVKGMPVLYDRAKDLAHDLRVGNVEQFTIEENPELYDFYTDCFSKVMERYGTIKKPLLANDLWKVMTTKRFNNP